MKKIIAFAGSDSKTSINKQLVTYATTYIKDAEVLILDLNDYPLPTYSVNVETESGFPENAKLFLEQLKSADGFVISLAEHNNAYTAVFKSLMDWLSRLELKFFYNKPMLLMSTSPGERAAKSVFDMGYDRFPRHDAQIVSTFNLPSFNDNFKNGEVVDEQLNTKLIEAVTTFNSHLN
ncbi:NADPH-dependent FMN reductase [Mesoflavibacter profundi]|uniref:NADPH-dependent FMN reductase n=1 Tax=Mesoflavibacter profundi TaxID=2708110 RepID=UPI003512BE0D